MAKEIFHRVWRGVMVLCLVVAALLAPSGRADAFGGAGISESRALGTCTMFFVLNPESGNAFVSLPSSGQLAGQAYYAGGNIAMGQPPITVTALNNCGITNVSNIVHSDPTATFEAQSYLGVTFTGTERGVVYNYEYALTNATATVVTATRIAAASNVSSLSSLTLSDVTLSPDFSANNTLYTATVPNSVTSTTVTPVVTDATATVMIGLDVVASGSGTNLSLVEGLNPITVEVTAEDGVHFTAYTINITREAPPSTDATLSALTLSGVTLNPAFSPSITSYTATVPLEANTTTVTATANQQNASLTLGGSPLASGAGAGFQLNSGTNTIAVVVTAQDGQTRQTYQVTVTKPEPNRAPVANPGYSGGQAGQTVTLTGINAVDPDTGTNAGLTYRWEQIDLTPGLPQVTLSSADARDATFTAPELQPGALPITLRFSLTVSDGTLSDTKPVSVVIFAPSIALPENEAVAKVVGKTAVNGTYTLTSGEVVTLSAADSTLPSEALPVYSWSSDAPGVTFGSPDAETTSFTAPVVTVPTEVEVALNISIGNKQVSPVFIAAPGPTVTIVPQSVLVLDPVILDFEGPTRDGALRAVLTIMVLPAVTEPPAETPTPEEIEAARQEVVKFVQTRSTLLLSNQPDMDDMLLSGASDGTANLTVSSMGGQADISTAPDKPVWLRLKGAWSTVDGAEGDYVLGSVGAHVLQGNGFAFGVMAQVDHLKTVDGLSVGEGTGWLAGPYAVVALQSHPVTVQGRLLYGRTDNSLSPDGTFEDKFSGDRLLALLGVSGEVARGTLTLKPTLSAGYVRETTEAYVNGAGIPVAATETALIQIAPGLEVSFPVAVSSGSMELTFGLADVWSGSAMGDASSFEGHRGRISAGVKRVFGSGAVLSASATYDGIGAPTYESLSVDLLLQHRF